MTPFRSLYLHTKFEVSSSNRSQDMEGSQYSKIRLRDPFVTPSTIFFIFIGSALGCHTAYQI